MKTFVSSLQSFIKFIIWVCTSL